MSQYRIHVVAQMTGLSPALIRSWEARHGLVLPQRSDKGYRLYSDEDVAVLRGVRRLIGQGMAPMQVAQLERHAILAHGCGAPPATGVEAGVAAPGEAAALNPAGPFSPHIRDIIEACADFDCAAVDRLLGPLLAVLSPDVACQQVLLPLLCEIGERWHRGQISVAVEHFGTCLVRSKLLSVIEILRHKAGPRQVVCACPPGESHELGLLMFTLVAALQGWRTIYLGVNLPYADLQVAVRRIKPEVTALSIATRHRPDTLDQLLQEAHQHLAQHTRVLLGGRGIAGMTDVVERSGCLLLPASGRLDDLLSVPLAKA